ncbi:ABC transporter substrate-binding protein [Rhodoplanes sp. Z2-YC6860]|uniref:ABC transporter substrate-binding protein n=1 Tax=Rhodoplanes sp. Z2-YC6860 TaxID=674703 RepID=UPI00078C6DDC|nr:ABC transporter substrate-binding protein [Rhodoplanes sp. Z2-YC6860]AMN42239.1 sulfonate/nitrate transport system substrate-binding protein [Rhodoplanes sp. Z2-YC6860]
MSRWIAGKSSILHAAIVAGLALSCLPAQAQKKDVTLRLDWIYQGPNSGFVVAKDKGFYDEAGLNVDLGPGKGSGSTAQLVASKATMFGFADGFVVGAGVSKGMNLTMVGAIYRRNPTALIVLKESGIKTPKDLEGKAVGIAPGGTQFQQWPAFVKGCKLDSSKIQVINVDPAGTVPALVANKVQGVASYAQGTVPGIEVRSKKETTSFMYADCGVTAVSNGIIVHNDLLKQDPNLVKAFVRATLKGFLYARQHTDEAIAITKKYAPEVVPEIAKREFEMTVLNWNTPNTMGKPLGWMSDKDWDATVETLKEYGGVTTPLKAADLYTNDFVPTESEFVPPAN